MSPRPSPDETRRPDVLSRPLRLADGNSWGFALPGPGLAPSFGRGTESIAVRAETSYPLEIQQRCAALRAAAATGPPARQYQAFGSLAVSLLRRAHDISRSEAVALLAVTDAELPRLVAEIIALAGGNLNE